MEAKKRKFKYKWKFKEMGQMPFSIDLDDITVKESYADTTPGWEPDLSTQFTRNIKLNLPIASAAMDTVTEADMAIQMALHGGIGVIHKNLTSEEEAREVEKVKRFKSGFITEPITVSPLTSIYEVEELRKTYGFGSFPVTEDGTPHGKLVGIITNKDYSIDKHGELLVKDRMNTDLVTERWGIDLEKAYDELLEARRGKLLLVYDDDHLAAMVTRKDLELRKEFPRAVKDKYDRLLVAAAVGGPGKDLDERAEKLYEAGVDVFVIDTSQGCSSGVEYTIKRLKKLYDDVDVVGGNVSNGECARKIEEWGADAVKVGIGPGSICITRNVTGVGGRQLNAIYEVSRSVKEIPIIADGGVRNYPQILYAIGAGAHSVMSGYLFAGHDECPGYVRTIKTKDGGTKKVKLYRGMGSPEAMKEAIEKGGGSRYLDENIVIHGEEKYVPYRGSVSRTLKELESYLKHSMKVFWGGAKSIEDVRKGENEFEIDLEKILSKGTEVYFVD